MILSQLIELLKSADIPQNIDACRDEIAQLIPEVSIMFDYDQNNRYHQYDLWMHTLMTICYLKDDSKDVTYLAALLHDIGKVESRCKGKRPDETQAHFYGHPAVSRRIVEQQIVPSLVHQGEVMDEKMQSDLIWLVEHHDDTLPKKDQHVLKIRDAIGKDLFNEWMKLQIADAKAHVILPKVLGRIMVCEKWLAYKD